MSSLRVTNLRGGTVGTSPTLPDGVVVTGVATATTFDGNATTATTATTATIATNAQGLTGSPNIDVGIITATNVSIGGTLTFEDVTNIDSVGIITAKAGINVTAGGADLKGVLQEKVVINTSNNLSAAPNINLSNGMVHYFTTAETGTSTPNIISSVGINTEMATGDTIAVTIITTPNGAGYSTCINIDGAYNDVKWSGGADPSAGGAASSNDVYALQIIKTGSAAYTVLGALNNFA